MLKTEQLKQLVVTHSSLIWTVLQHQALNLKTCSCSMLGQEHMRNLMSQLMNKNNHHFLYKAFSTDPGNDSIVSILLYLYSRTEQLFWPLRFCAS